MRKGKVWLLFMMILLFLLGAAIFFYPYINGMVVNSTLKWEAQQFVDRITNSIEVVDETMEEEPISTPPEQPYASLREAMEVYNRTIWEEKQEGLCDPWSYQQPSFVLEEYGLADEVFGVISIPKLDLELPLFLGASEEHLSDGAAVLSQTSIPIGGINTNCVIAGHRGWYGASYFLHIDQLQPGDEIIITNLWESLHYTVAETKTIKPNDVEAIHIQKNRELLTLLTCHPPASGGKERLLVFCERTT